MRLDEPVAQVPIHLEGESDGEHLYEPHVDPHTRGVRTERATNQGCRPSGRVGLADGIDPSNRSKLFDHERRIRNIADHFKGQDMDTIVNELLAMGSGAGTKLASFLISKKDSAGSWWHGLRYHRLRHHRLCHHRLRRCHHRRQLLRLCHHCLRLCQHHFSRHASICSWRHAQREAAGVLRGPFEPEEKVRAAVYLMMGREAGCQWTPTGKLRAQLCVLCVSSRMRPSKMVLSGSTHAVPG
jgi:hypothetical protein